MVFAAEPFRGPMKYIREPLFIKFSLIYIYFCRYIARIDKDITQPIENPFIPFDLGLALDCGNAFFRL